MLIDANCLNESENIRFIQNLAKTQSAFLKALNGLLDHNCLPYVPKIYILPHYQRLISGKYQKITFNMLGSDPIEKEKLSIFISLPFIEEHSENILTMTFIHELVHLINLTYTSKIELQKLLDKKKISLKTYDEYSHNYTVDLSNFFTKESLSLYNEWNSITQSKKFTKDLLKKRKKRKDYVTFKNPTKEFPSYFFSIYNPDSQQIIET